LAALALSPTRRAWPLPAPPATQTSAVLVFDDPPAPPAPYTLSLHDALPISAVFEPALKANEKVTVTATDPAGNSNDKTDTVPDFIGLYSDNEAPNAPVIDEISHDKTSTDDNEHTTVIKGNVQDKNGAPEVGATVVVTDKDGNSITDDNGDPITATTDEDGDFEIELPLLDEDEHSITATDKAGNESNPTDFIVDYTPPAEPEINIENGGITNNADDTTTIKGNVK